MHREANITRQSNRKIPWRLSQPQKARQRKRLRGVDRVVDTVSAALERNGYTTKAVERWYREMPREEEMLPKDKYTLFDKKEKKYRKGIHSTLYSWTFLRRRWTAFPNRGSQTKGILFKFRVLMLCLFQSYPSGPVSARE